MILRDHLTKAEVLVEIHHIVADQPQCQVWMTKLDLRDERTANIVQCTLPTRIRYPAKLPVDPHAKATGVPRGMVLLAHVWPVDIAQFIVVAEFTSSEPFPTGMSRGMVAPFPRTS